MRKQNSYGVPIFNEMESALLHAALLSCPCKVCGAKIGHACVVGRYQDDGTSSYADTSNKMKDGSVHMGRLPKGFHSERAVDEALAKLGFRDKVDGSV